MTDAVFAFSGVEMIADISGALVLPALSVAVVADLHLEKGSSLARRGALLPPYDSRATLSSLSSMLERRRPKTVVCLGDSFHDGQGAERLSAGDRSELRGLMAGRDWIWVLGNHDPAPASGLGGEATTEVELAGLTLRHEADAAARPGEISGHFHPKISVRTGARRITAPCFVGDDDRLILPSFGAFTGGLDVFDPAIRRLLATEFRVWIRGRRHIHEMPVGAPKSNKTIRPSASAVRQSTSSGGRQ